MSFWRKLCRKLCKPVGEVVFARGVEHRYGAVLVGWTNEEGGAVCLSEGVKVLKTTLGFSKGGPRLLLLLCRILSFVSMWQSHWMQENSDNISSPNHSRTLPQDLASMRHSQEPYNSTWMQTDQFGKDPKWKFRDHSVEPQKSIDSLSAIALLARGRWNELSQICSVMSLQLMHLKTRHATDLWYCRSGIRLNPYVFIYYVTTQRL